MKHKKILIINGHPSKDSLSEALANAYTQSAMYSGADVRRINIRDLKFDPILHEGYKKIQSLEVDLKKVQNNLVWAEHLVFIYPIWWGTMPALVKGFIDRVFLPGFAFKYTKNSGFPERYFKGKTARVINTSGGPKLYYMFVNPNKKIMKKPVLGFVGIKNVKFTHFGSMGKKLSQKRAKSIFGKVKKLGKKRA